jgi:hypothetical protein
MDRLARTVRALGLVLVLSGAALPGAPVALAAPPAAPGAQLSAEDYYGRGADRAHAGDLRGAIDDLSHALRLDPTLVDAYRERAVALATLGSSSS